MNTIHLETTSSDLTFDDLYLRFDATITEIYAAANAIFERLDLLSKDAATLKEQPHFIGNPVYTRNKYLVLVPPMIDGERKHHYIGNNPAKISDALARIERGKLLRDIVDQIINKQETLLTMLAQLDAIRDMYTENANDK